MTKYIYRYSDLRCRLKPTGYKNEIEIQLQKRKWIFWVNCFPWMHIKEGFWGECERHKILTDSYRYGNISEAYMTGTLDIHSRVNSLFDEYLRKVNENIEFKKQFQNI